MKSQALIYEKREAQTVEYWKRELVVYDSKGVLQMMRVIKYQAPRKSGDDHRVTEIVRVGGQEWSEQYAFKDETRALEFYQRLSEYENQIVIVESAWNPEIGTEADTTGTGTNTSTSESNTSSERTNSFSGLWKRIMTR